MSDEVNSIYTTSVFTIHEVIIQQFGKDKAWIRQRTVERAQKIAVENLGYDLLCWFLAETDLVLRRAYALFHTGELEKVPTPTISDADIRPRAQMFYNLRPTIAELHWFLAERQILLECLYKRI